MTILVLTWSLRIVVLMLQLVLQLTLLLGCLGGVFGGGRRIVALSHSLQGVQMTAIETQPGTKAGRYVCAPKRSVDRYIENRPILRGTGPIEVPPLSRIHGETACLHGVAQPAPVGLRDGTDAIGGIGQSVR